MSIRDINQNSPVTQPVETTAGKDNAQPAGASAGSGRNTAFAEQDQNRLKDHLTRSRASIGTQFHQELIAAKLPQPANNNLDQLTTAVSAERTAVVNVLRSGDDNAVRRLSDAQIATATPDEKATLVRKLLKGFTGNDDEQAVLRILRSEAGDVSRFDRVINQVDMRNLVDNLQGGEFQEFQQLVRDVRFGSIKPGDWQDYQKYLDVVTETRVQPGNNLTLLNGGELAFNTMFSAIDNAKETVNYEMYQLHNDKTGNEMVDHLINAAKRGVTVNVLLDGFGNLTKQNGDLVDRLKQNGVNVIVNPFSVTPINIDHRKVLVIDGQTGFTGGMNTGDKYRYEISDLHSKLEGPAVADLQKAFLQRWTEEGGQVTNRDRYFPPLKEQGNQAVRVVPHNPGSDENIRNLYLRAIDTATKSIYLQCPFFGDNEVMEHLKAAAQRGVDVNIVLPAKNSQIWTREAARYSYKDLIAAGVKVFEYQPTFAHEKVCVIDSQFATIGSSNLDALSLRRDHELNLVTIDPGFAANIESAIKADIKNSKQITKPTDGWLNKLGQSIFRKIEDWI